MSRASKYPLNEWVPATFTKDGKVRKGWKRRRIGKGGKGGKSIFDTRTTSPYVPRGKNAPGEKKEVTIKGKTFMATVKRKLPQTSVPGQRVTIVTRDGKERTYIGKGGSGVHAWKQERKTKA